VLDRAIRQTLVIGAEHDPHPMIPRDSLQAEYWAVRCQTRDRYWAFVPAVIQIVEPQTGNVTLDSMKGRSQLPRLFRELDAGREPFIEYDFVKRCRRSLASRGRSSRREGGPRRNRQGQGGEPNLKKFSAACHRILPHEPRWRRDRVEPEAYARLPIPPGCAKRYTSRLFCVKLRFNCLFDDGAAGGPNVLRWRGRHNFQAAVGIGQPGNTTRP